jgi:formylglycine-generating enzyme required for sulfatase activity
MIHKPAPLTIIRLKYLCFLGLFLAASLVWGDQLQPASQVLYTGDYHGTGIYKITPDGTSSVFYSGEGAGGGLGFDLNGNLYTAHGGTIDKVTPDGKGSTFATGIKSAFGLAVDSLGNVYCTEYQDKIGTVCKFAPDGTKSIVDSGLTWPYGMSSDSNGNVYLATLGTHFWRFDQAGKKTDMGPLAGWGRTAIMDLQGSFYTLGFNLTKVSQGQSVGMFAPGIDFEHAVGLAVDNQGNLYQSNCAERGEKEGLIYKYTADGRRSVFCHLPCQQPFWLAFYPPTITPSADNKDASDQVPARAPSTSPPAAPGSKLNAKDGAEVVMVPAGEVTMGADSLTDAEARKVVNTPKHTVNLDGYWIYKYDVTVAQYRKFCADTGQAMPQAPPWGWREDNPIVNVNWDNASKYAKWAGASLPTEAQWEKAARGMDGRNFPWGNDWAPERCVHSNVKWGDQKSTEAVGSRPDGASPYGVMDMVGNVWNWCNDWYADDYYQTSPAKNPTGAPWWIDVPASKDSAGKEIPATKHWSLLRVVRGGAWTLCDPKDFRTTNRDWASSPAYEGNDVGFRCVLPEQAIDASVNK